MALPSQTNRGALQDILVLWVTVLTGRTKLLALALPQWSCSQLSFYCDPEGGGERRHSRLQKRH